MRARVRLAYRGDLAVQALADVAVGLVGVVFLSALFARVPHVRGWTFHELLFVWGFAEAATGLSLSAFQGLWQLNQRYILDGEMDRVLLRPLDPYLQVLLDNAGPQGLPLAALGAAMMGAAAPALPGWSPLQWALLPVFLVGSVATLGGLLTLTSAVGFRVHHRGTAVGLVQQAAVFNRYPVDLFHRRLQLALTFGLPVAFTGFYPASWYLGRTEWLGYALAQPLVGAACLGGAVWAWRRALRGYRSPGS